MIISIWKREDPLEPGKLVVCQGFYLIFESFDGASACILEHPFRDDIRIRASLENIKHPFITPWAEKMAAMINERKEAEAKRKERCLNLTDTSTMIQKVSGEGRLDQIPGGQS